jgi:2,4-dienoyl-CoA reductase (NADPH2)
VSASGRFRLLLSPARLGPVVVRNRIVFSAHLTNFAEDGRPSAQHAAYYEARAAGGAGLIVTEEHSTHPTDWPYEKLIHGFSPEVIPGYRRITEGVHRHDTPIFAQINHNGGQGSGLYSRLPVWAPSPIADPLFREVPKAVTTAEIAEIVAGYANVAEHCRRGGFDGVELQCSHSSIVRGFLSPATNVRTDAYGGSLEGRSRLLFEIVAAVREAIGPGLALGVRLCGDELIDRGTTIEDAVAVARRLEAGGLVDYLNTSIGVATATLFMIEASMQVPPGYALWIASALRRAVDLPVIGVGRLKDPLQAERALAEGHADLIGVVRGQIADPDFAAKTRAGTSSTIRICLSCNQECVGRMGLNRWLGCIENPRTGREAQPLLGPTRRRRVLVVGAGAAGLQTAIAAARRGHQVEVVEAASVAGGQVREAASVPSRAELGDLVRNQLAELRALGVPIRYETTADRSFVVAAGADVVVVATGARPARPWWAGSSPQVVDVRDVITGRVAPTGSVLVVDELGFHQATSVAELLADRGCRVEVVAPAMVVGQDLGITLDMETWWMKAVAKEIEQTTDTMVTAVVERDEGDGLEVELQQHTTGRTSRRRVDWVVGAVPGAPEDALWRTLRQAPGFGARLERVGDCVAPRRAQAAVIEGDRVGGSL